MEAQFFLLYIYVYASVALVQTLFCNELDKSDIGFSLNSTCDKICVFPITLTCKDNICVCKAGYYPDYDIDKCILCPGLLEMCDTCCQKGLICYDSICQQDLGYIEYTSAVAFGVAIILGICALGSVIWKVFISTYRFERHGSMISNNSMNSIQRLVNERLQNRPPTYAETVRQQRIDRRAMEAPPPYTLFCRDETNVVPSEFNETVIIDSKDNTPAGIVTGDTAVHI